MSNVENNLRKSFREVKKDMMHLQDQILVLQKQIEDMNSKAEGKKSSRKK